MQALLKEYSKRPQRPVSLHQMLQYGVHLDNHALFNGSVFLRDEIPVRLAHRIIDLDAMPNGLCTSPLVQRVRELYVSSLRDCLALPAHHTSFDTANGFRPYEKNAQYDQKVNIDEYNLQVYEALKKIKERHNHVVEMMARGVQEYLKTTGKPVSSNLQRFLEDFYASRIGIRCLIGHHIALFEQNASKNSDPSWVGIICKRTDVLQVCKNAINDALFVFETRYGPFTAPHVTFHVTEKRPELRYIPSHVHHMLFELAKNSLRATYEAHYGKEEHLPNVRIVISEGSEDITIKVADEGGGIPRSAERLIWSFGYTTAELGEGEEMPIAGFGYGLPLSRLYARYFGGELKVISMDGYGTDAYLNLSRLSDSREPVIP